MLFKDISMLSSCSHSFQCIKNICVILVKGILRNFYVKLFGILSSEGNVVEMKKINKQCLLDTPRTVRVSEKTWQVIVRTRRP